MSDFVLSVFNAMDAVEIRGCYNRGLDNLHEESDSMRGGCLVRRVRMPD